MFSNDVKRCDFCCTVGPESTMQPAPGTTLTMCRDIVWCQRQRAAPVLEKILLGPPPARLALHTPKHINRLELVARFLERSR